MKPHHLRMSTLPLPFTLVLALGVLTACGGNDQDPILGTGNALVYMPPANAVVAGTACANAGAGIPTVTLTDPSESNQATPTSTAGVANGGKTVSATFSLPMNPTTLDGTGFSLARAGGALLTPAAVSYNATTQVATLTTAGALLADTSYTAVIQNTATSSAGSAVGCPVQWTFKTAPVAATGPAPVNLGAVAPMGIAAAAGLTNTATQPNTVINGNVVLSPTATCNATTVDTVGGFGLCGGQAPALNGTVVSSQFTPAQGPGALQVMTALRASYEGLTKASRPNATVLGCATIGTGGGAGAGVGCAGNATLPPGTFVSSTDASIGVTGTLTLDGRGDQNARFIFQMPSSTLTTATGAPGAPAATITLINGAKASNVFWQVGSSATLGSYTEFKGNVLADTSITLGTGATACGRLLAGAVTATGAFVLDSNVVSVPGHALAPAGCL